MKEIMLCYDTDENLPNDSGQVIITRDKYVGRRGSCKKRAAGHSVHEPQGGRNDLPVVEQGQPLKPGITIMEAILQAIRARR